MIVLLYFIESLDFYYLIGDEVIAECTIGQRGKQLTDL